MNFFFGGPKLWFFVRLRSAILIKEPHHVLPRQPKSRRRVDFYLLFFLFTFFRHFFGTKRYLEHLSTCSISRNQDEVTQRSIFSVRWNLPLFLQFTKRYVFPTFAFLSIFRHQKKSSLRIHFYVPNGIQMLNWNIYEKMHFSIINYGSMTRKMIKYLKSTSLRKTSMTTLMNWAITERLESHRNISSSETFCEAKESASWKLDSDLLFRLNYEQKFRRLSDKLRRSL